MTALLLSVLVTFYPVQDRGPVSEALDDGQALLDGEGFPEAERRLRGVLEVHPDEPDALYQLGLALAGQRKWAPAKRQFETVLSLDPQYTRAYLELAGIAFERARYDEAARYLDEALELEPDSAYALDFRATLHYLKDEEIAALADWNRIGVPRVDRISYSAARPSAELLERLFSFNEAEVLRREGILEARWKQERLGLDPPFRFDLTPTAENWWDLEVILPPRSTLGFVQEILLGNGLRAPFGQEVSVAYPQETGRGRRVSAAYRWDPKKQRLLVSARLPFVTAAPDSLRFDAELVDEQWRHAAPGIRYGQKHQTFSVQYEHLFAGRKSLSVAAGYRLGSIRLDAGLPESEARSHLLRLSTEWRQRIGLNDADTLRLDVSARYESFLAPGGGDAGRQLSATIRLPWSMNAGTGSRLQASFGFGVSGDAPLEEYFVFGVGRDDPLALRAHPTTSDGYKGHAPMGRSYVLFGLEYSRRLFQWKAVSLTGLAFSDNARVAGSPFGVGAPTWYHDIGLGLGLDLLGRRMLDLSVGVDGVGSGFAFWIGPPGV